jgi:archaellum biogenesis ATPase FlaH
MAVLLEHTIIRQVMSTPKLAEQIAPYLKDEYFESQPCATIYTLFREFYDKYRAVPSFAALRLGLDDLRTLSERDAKATTEVLDDIEQMTAMEPSQHPYLVEQAEKYCQDRALYVALRKSVAMLDNPEETPHGIPDLLRDALSVSFDTHVGHDFFGDAESRYEFYHRAESRIPFDLEVFNGMTKGGVPTKTLNCVLAGTNVGKSLFLVHMAAACLRMSKNVLYVTLEMAEERIAERIDANMMNVPMDDVVALSRSQYNRKIEGLRSTSTGKLIIKEYPTGAAHSGHFRSLLQELKGKQNFTPDIVFIDYLSICSSARVKMGNSVNSYTYNKSIAEELRGLAVEHNLPIFTAAQFNRDGHGASDPGLDKISESFAIAQTADFIIALTTTEDLERSNQIQVYTLKNRYGKRNSFEKFLLGIDTSRMMLYNPSGTAVHDISLGTAADSQSPFSSMFSGASRMPRRPLAPLHTGGLNETETP